MEIFTEKDNKTINYEIKKETTIKEILDDLGVGLESVIIVKNNEVCLEDETVNDKDKLKLLNVVSGG